MKNNQRLILRLVLLVLVIFAVIKALCITESHAAEMTVFPLQDNLLNRQNPSLKLCLRNAEYFDEVKMREAVAHRARWGISSKELEEWELWSANESKWNYSNMAPLERVSKWRTRWKFLGPVYSLCPVPLTVFGDADEEKRFCLPASALAATKKNCQVLSIGGNNQWQFEVDVYKKTACDIHTFDCTVMKPRMPLSISDRVRFHHVCIDGHKRRGVAGHNPDAQFMTLSDLLRLSGGKHAPGSGSYHTLFKMDVEGYEWPVFREMVRELELKGKDADVALPDQLYVEVHYKIKLWNARPKTPMEIYQLSEALFWQLGYIVTDSRPNPRCGTCLEVLFQRVLC